MRDVFYDVFVMFILRVSAVFKLLQFIDGHVVNKIKHRQRTQWKMTLQLTENNRFIFQEMITV